MSALSWGRWGFLRPGPDSLPTPTPTHPDPNPKPPPLSAVLIFECYAGVLPFTGESSAAVFAAIRAYQVPWAKIRKRKDPHVESLVRALLNPNQLERLGVGERGSEAVKVRKEAPQRKPSVGCSQNILLALSSPVGPATPTVALSSARKSDPGPEPQPRLPTQAHPFFSGLNWSGLHTLDMEFKPAFEPQLTRSRSRLLQSQAGYDVDPSEALAAPAKQVGRWRGETGQGSSGSSGEEGDVGCHVLLGEKASSPRPSPAP